MSIDAGDIEARLDPSESRRFLQACQCGDLDSLKERCAARRVDWTVYRHGSSGDTGLHVAAREGRIRVVKYLCENWPELEYRAADVANFDMKRPLHEAAQFARYDVLEYLIQRGAEIDALKRADWTPLMLACTKSGAEAQRCVNKLLLSGADLSLRNKDGWTPLLIACRSGDPVIIEQLLKRSARCADDRSNNGRGPLHIAALHGHRAALEMLLDAMPDLLESRDSAGSTPLHESVKSLNFNVTDYLLKKGAYIGAVDNVGQSVLHVAASVGNVAAIRYFLDRGEPGIDAEAHFAITPLRIAERNKQHEAARLLSRNLHENRDKRV